MAATNSERVDGLRRRGVFAGALASIAALVVGRSSSALAASDSPPNGPLIGGSKNTTTRETDLAFVQDDSLPPDPALCVSQGSSMAMLGGAPVDLKTFRGGTAGRTFDRAAVAGESDGNIGVFGNAGPAGVGLWGLSDAFIGSWGASNTGVGVLGQTYSADIAGHEKPYQSAGVLGIGGRAPGTWGISMSSVGAWGESQSGPGVLGQTGAPASANQNAAAGQATGYPVAGVLGIDNLGASAGVWGLAKGRGIGTWGQSDQGIGIAAQSNNIGAWFKKGNVPQKLSDLEPAAYHATAMGTDTAGCNRADMGVALMGESNHIGAWFKVGDVNIDPKTLESAAMHTTALGDHVSTCARAERGVAVEAMVTHRDGVAIATEVPTGGIALRAEGRLLSNMIMLADIPKGVDQFEIPCNLIYGGTHVSIQVRSDVGAAVTWVETRVGKAVIVHFDKKTKAAGSLSYALTERFSEMGGPY